MHEPSTPLTGGLPSASPPLHSNESSHESEHPSACATQAARTRRAGLGAMLILIVPALGVLGWFGHDLWASRQHANRQIQQLEQRLAASEAQERDSAAASQANRDTQETLQKRLNDLEALVSQQGSRQEGVERLIQELAQGRDEWIEAEVEQWVGQAAQQLQLGGNVPGAILALSTADARLARMDRPQWLAVRKALARDIESLRALPQVDLAGMSLRLDQWAAKVDGLPMAFDGHPKASASSTKVEASWTKNFLSEVWQELRSLIHVERLDHPAPELLSPQNAFFLRENLRLKLLSARLSLQARDQVAFRRQVEETRSWIERYFDPRHPEVRVVKEGLTSLLKADLVIALPSIHDSLESVRRLRLTVRSRP